MVENIVRVVVQTQMLQTYKEKRILFFEGGEQDVTLLLLCKPTLVLLSW